MGPRLTPIPCNSESKHPRSPKLELELDPELELEMDLDLRTLDLGPRNKTMMK